MSPFVFSEVLFDADLTVKNGGARAATLVADVTVQSISDLFDAFAAARQSGDRARMAQIRLAAGPALLAELDGFDYPAAA